MATQNGLNLPLSGNIGTGRFVGETNTVLTTPTLGVATATSVNKVTLTAPATGSTLTIADGKTLTQSNTLTYTGTDGSTVNFGAGGTVSYGGSGLSWTDANSTPISAAVNTGYVVTNAGTVTINLPTTAALGDIIKVQGGVPGIGGWILAPQGGGNIRLGSVNATVSVASANQYDSISVICIIPASGGAVTWSLEGAPQTTGFTYS